jgi:YHS domain-containing protein
MKAILPYAGLAAILMGAVLGCSQKEETMTPSAEAPPAATSPAAVPAVTTAYPLGTIKVGDKAVCVLCAANEGAAEPEEVKATLDYKGKTYAFCNLEEKAKFISDPAKYAQSGP